MDVRTPWSQPSRPRDGKFLDLAHSLRTPVRFLQTCRRFLTSGISTRAPLLRIQDNTLTSTGPCHGRRVPACHVKQRLEYHLEAQPPAVGARDKSMMRTNGLTVRTRQPQSLVITTVVGSRLAYTTQVIYPRHTLRMRGSHVVL